MQKYVDPQRVLCSNGKGKGMCREDGKGEVLDSFICLVDRAQTSKKAFFCCFGSFSGTFHCLWCVFLLELRFHRALLALHKASNPDPFRIHENCDCSRNLTLHILR